MVAKGRKVVRNPTGFHCVNLLVQRAIGKAQRLANARARGGRWNDENREHISETSKALYEEKREQRIEETTTYRNNNRERLTKAQCKREKERRETNADYRAAVLLRQRLRGALGRNCDKMDKTLALIGCTVTEFNAHIDSQNSLGDDEIQLDHIFPFQFYDLQTDQPKVMNFTNYQPLTPHENRQKWKKLPTKGSSQSAGSASSQPTASSQSPTVANSPTPKRK